MEESLPKIIKYVNSGEVYCAGTDTLLNSGAIGSCVVITAFDPQKKIGAMAHVMLPGTSPDKNPQQKTRYARNAIEELIWQLKKLGISPEKIEICLAGGANVLVRENDSIGKDNLDSVENILLEKQMEVKARSIGGFERRTVLFDVMKGCIYYTLGDSDQKILWKIAAS